MYIYSNCSFCGKPVVRRKQTKDVIHHFCHSGCKSAYQRLAKPVTREWLEEQYIDKKMDCSQIGRMVDRDSKTVWGWLKDFGIPTRPRGSNPPPETPAGEGNPFYGKKHSEKTRAVIRDMRLKDGHVPYKKDGVHYMKHRGFSQEDHPAWKGGATPERQAFYSSPEWADAVKAVWARDNATCQRCGKHHNTALSRGTFHIHHIVSFAVAEKRAEVDNLLLLCDKCHRWVHSNKNTGRDFIKEKIA